METTKQERLEAAGFKVGSVAEFLDLTPDEEAMIELRMALSAVLRQRKTQQHLSQAALAKRLGSSQSRIAKMETGETSVSLDLLIKAYFALGATREELGKAIAARPSEWLAATKMP